MIYHAFEFIDLKSREILIENNNYKILDFSSSIIIDYLGYQKFINNILTILHNPHLITVKIKYYLRYYCKINNFNDSDYLQFINVIYNAMANPYYYNFKLLKKLIKNEVLYFFALNFLFYFSIQSYSMESFKLSTTETHNKENNNRIQILTDNMIKKLINERCLNNDFSDEINFIFTILYDYDYYFTNNELVTPFQYLQTKYSIEEFVALIRQRYTFLDFIPQSADVNLYYLFLILIRDHQLYFVEDELLFSHYYFFIFYGQLLLPTYIKNEDITTMIKKLKSFEDINVYCLLNDANSLHPILPDIQVNVIEKFLPEDVKIRPIINVYPHVEELDNNTIIFRQLFLKQFNNDIIKFIGSSSSLLDNIIKFSRNSLSFYNIFNILIRLSDGNLENIGFYRFNMPIETLAHRINSLYIESISDDRSKDKTYWMLTTFYQAAACKNSNNLTIAAQSALNKGPEYAEYAQEKFVDNWKSNSYKIFLMYFERINKRRFAFSLQDIQNYAEDPSTYNLFVNRDFNIKELNDLIKLLKDSNCSLFTNVINSLQKLRDNRNNLGGKGFIQFYKNLDNPLHKQLIKKYFYSYFMLINYTRFWIGPGNDMNAENINKPDIILFYRDYQVQRIIQLINSYREEIALFASENWDDDLFLLYNFQSPLKFFNHDVTRKGKTTVYNSSKLYQRIQLLAEGLFCMGIFCEQAKYIINSIIVYLGESNNFTVNDYVKIRNFLQKLSDEVLPSIVQDMLKTNDYQQQLLNPTYEYDIYKRMIAYYYILKCENVDNVPVEYKEVLIKYQSFENQKQRLHIPIFLFPVDYASLDCSKRIIDVPIVKVKECLEFLKIEVRENTAYELFNKAYEYYRVIFEYQILQNYINNNCKQDISHLQQYYNIYHNISSTDELNINQYVNYC